MFISQYNLLIDGHAKECLPSSAIRAEELLEMMHANAEKNGGHCRPDLVTYNIVLQAIANSGAEDAISRAEALISKLNELSDTKLQPNSITYNTLLDAMIHRGELQKAEALLQSMQTQYETGANTSVLNKSSFNIMINGYAKSRDRDGVEQAEILLQKLIEMSESPAQDGEVNIFKPDAFSFASIVDAHARRGKKGAVDRAQELLYQMEHVLNITPNRVFFNTMINLLAKSRERGAPQRAEEILNRMQELYKAGNLHVKPDDITFSTVINAWAVSSEPRKAEHAESILRHLAGAGRNNTTGVKPNMIMYSATINAWARTTDDPHHVDRALQLLNDMEELYAAGNKYVRPNGHCYNAVLNSMAKSPTLIDKPQRVHEFFERMMNTYKMDGNSGAKPTTLTFSTIINACAFSNDDKLEAFNIARKALRTLIASPDLFGPPNNFVFGNFLLACSKLLPQNDTRRKIVMSTFQECCRLGQVDGLVLKNFLFASHRADAVDILGHDFSGTLEELPVEWRYNAMKRTSGNRQNEKHRAPPNRSKQLSSLQT
jgi:pentatricopeptide repeat protein